MKQPCPVCLIPCLGEVLHVDRDDELLIQTITRCPTHGRRVFHTTTPKPEHTPKEPPKLWNAGEGTCERCGTTYTKRKRKQRFCSAICRDNQNKGKPRGTGPGEGTCGQCGERFAKRTHTARFCSRLCSALGRRLHPV